jgi:hypothetical protein
MPRVLNKHKDIIPPNAVYVGRPTIYGNPFAISRGSTREQVVTAHKELILSIIESNPGFLDQLKADLAGRDLICFCAPLPCHADILLELANS